MHLLIEAMRNKINVFLFKMNEGLIIIFNIINVKVPKLVSLCWVLYLSYLSFKF